MSSVGSYKSNKSDQGLDEVNFYQSRNLSQKLGEDDQRLKNVLKPKMISGEKNSTSESILKAKWLSNQIKKRHDGTLQSHETGRNL